MSIRRILSGELTADDGCRQCCQGASRSSVRRRVEMCHVGNGKHVLILFFSRHWLLSVPDREEFIIVLLLMLLFALQCHHFSVRKNVSPSEGRLRRYTHVVLVQLSNKCLFHFLPSYFTWFQLTVLLYSMRVAPEYQIDPIKRLGELFQSERTSALSSGGSIEPSSSTKVKLSINFN